MTIAPQSPIYLDHHATTPVDPRVLDAMLPYFTREFGNAGSTTHVWGHAAKAAVDDARQQIAAAIGAQPSEIVFTSGATESNNLALRGVATRPRRRGNRLVSVTTEHRAVLEPLARLASAGLEVELVPVLPAGRPDAGKIDLAALAAAVTDDTLLVSVMLANNEIGVLQPLAEIADLCRQRGALLHTDATQAVGKVPVDVDTLGVNLLSFTAHKLYGPKGIGVLYTRRMGRPVRLEPLLTGGGQEGGLRAGTLNVPGIVGLAAALRIATEELATESTRLDLLRDRLFQRLRQAIPGLELSGPELAATTAAGTPLRLPGNLNVRLPRIDGETLLMRLPDLALSSGATCSAATPEPSHVLLALGLSADQARCSLRFGLGRWNTAAEIDTAAERIAAICRELQPH